MSGYIEALRVPGNFNIGQNAFGDLVREIEAAGYLLDNSFEIRHLSFGRLSEFDLILNEFPDANLLHPLDGYKVQRPESEQKMRCDFFINAVPAIFESEAMSQLEGFFYGRSKLRYSAEAFQLTAQMDGIDYSTGASQIVFSYRISPFAIYYSNARENFFQFFISMLAILGGVFTFAGIVDSIIHSGSKVMFKEQINKQI